MNTYYHGLRLYKQISTGVSDYSLICNNDYRTALDLASMNGHERVVCLLFEVISKVSPNDLKWMVNKLGSPLHLAISGGHLSVAKFLLHNDVIKSKVNLEHHIGDFCPIEHAVYLNHESIAMEIIKTNSWKNALDCKWVGTQEGKTTVFKELIKKMPRVAHHVLDKCIPIKTIDSEAGKKDEFYCIDYVKDGTIYIESGPIPLNPIERKEDLETGINDEPFCFDYVEDDIHKFSSYFRDKSQWTKKGSKRDHPLQIMVDHKQRTLLYHPLTMALLNSKWKSYGGPAYGFGLLFYTIFLIFLTSFALVSPNPQESTCLAVANGKFNSKDSLNISTGFGNCFTNSSVDDICSNVTRAMECGLREECGICRQSNHTRVFSIIAACIISCMGLLQLLFEVFQFLTQGLIYLKDYTNYVDLLLSISTCIFSISALSACVCPTSWQWQIGTVAVFLAWINLLIYLRMLPIGVHILMFEQICRTFAKTIVLTLTLVVAFAIAFFMLFHVPSQDYERSPFSTGWRSHVKVMAMTTGEINFDNAFRLSAGCASPDDMIPELPFLGATYPLWILFLIAMPILLSNLLTGLAIDDVNKIKEESEIKGLGLKIDFMLNMEQLLKFTKIYDKKYSKILKKAKLRKNSSFGGRLMEWCFGIAENCYYDVDTFKQRLQPKDIRKNQHNLDDVVKRMEAIESTMKEMKDMMITIASKIPTTEPQAGE